jgi:RHS repeat-associated protein
VDSSTTNTTLANLNPFRYRSYYYDTETGFYFLKTRYYDPELGRFMTIDDLSYLDPESINGLNLYAYCGNNPINRYDSTGCDWESFWNNLWGKIIGTTLVVVAVIALSIATAGIGTAVAGALGGGFLAAIAGGAVGGAISGAIFGTGISIISQGVTNGYSNIDYRKVAIDGLIGMALGAVSGAIFAGIGRGLGLLGKTKWAQRTLSKFDHASKNYMFGSKSGNFTFLRNGKTFRLEASLQHGLHYHSLSAGTTAPQWELIFKISNLIAGVLGGSIGNAL